MIKTFYNFFCIFTESDVKSRRGSHTTIIQCIPTNYIFEKSTIKYFNYNTYLKIKASYLFSVFIEDMFSDKVRSLELLAAEWTQPLVLRQLLSVRLDELFNFSFWILEKLY